MHGNMNVKYIMLVTANYESHFFRKYFKTLFTVSLMCKSAN